MSKQTFYIALNYVTSMYRYRSTLIFGLLMPVVFTAVLGTVLTGSGDSAQPRWAIAVVDEDAAPISAALIDRLAARPELDVHTTDLSAAELQVRQGRSVSMLVIPAGFSTALRSRQTPALTMTVSGDQVRAEQAVELAVRAAVSELRGINQAAELASVASARTPGQAMDYGQALASAEALWEGPRPLRVAVQAETRAAFAQQVPTGFDQSSPGMLVTFGLVLMLGGATVLVAEREQGTLRRLLVMPLRQISILGGKLGGIWTIGIAQAAALILVGALAFHVAWGQSPAALAAMVAAFSFSIAALGMLIAGLARTYAQANAVTNILMYSMAAIGGAWWPIEITPAWMQQAAKLLPTYWAMQGFQDIIARGLGLSSVLPEVAALLAFGVLFMGIASWRFRYE